MTQATIPFVRESDTSRAAAASVQPNASSLRRRVLDYIASRGEHGATDDEIEGALDLRHQTASARRRELVMDHRIYDTGERRPTRSGRTATVWRMVPRGTP